MSETRPEPMPGHEPGLDPEAQRRLAGLADAVPGIMAYWSPDLRCRFANRAYLEWFDRDESQVVGRTVAEIFGPDYEQAVREPLDAVMAGHAQHFERRTTRADGEARYHEVHFIPDKGADGQVRGAFVMAFDITRLKRAEHDLLKANDALRHARDAAMAADAAKSRFLANMSHEIRTPLNGMLGMAQIGLRESFGRGRAQETFARILDSGKLLLTVVNDILDLSKIEASKLDIESLPLDPAALARSTLQGVAELASAKSLALRADAPPLGTAVLGDPARIAQVLFNLLTNAIKFTSRGEVCLSLAHVQDTTGEHLQFTVHDTGIGIASEDLGRLFQPFEQADASISRRFGGSGLGLAISRRLAGLMGGELTVRSVLGEGSSFTLRLPWRPTDLAPPVTAGRPPSQASRRLVGVRVLVAEDNAVNQQVMFELLSGEGARVVLASDGQQALEALRREAGRFDAVLMDVQMPVMDGLAAVRTYRAQGGRLPVIGQTASALKEESSRCLSAGMNAVVHKPIDLDLLVSTLLEQLRTARCDSGATSDPGVLDASRGGAEAGTAAPPPLAAADPLGPVAWPQWRRRYAGRPEFIGRLARSFHDSHAGDVDKLRQLALSQNLDGIERLAHELKGSAGHVFAAQLERLAASAMERARRRSHAALTDALLLADALEQVLIALQNPPP